MVVPPDPTDEPPPGAVLDELGDGCALVGVGVGDGEAAFTVTTGALADTATGDVPLPTVTVAVNVILSPDAADFGTSTCASASGVGGGVFGSVMGQFVLPVQPTVNAGGASVGVLLLAATLSVTVAASLEEAQAEILNRTVPPGCTVVWEAVTVTVGFAGGVGVGLVDDGVGDAEDLDGVGDAEDLLGVALAVCVGVVGALGVVDAVADVEVLGELVAVDEVDARGFADELVGFTVGDGVAVGVAARAELVMPLEMTKMPVATPSVTGRECADRMRTPCLVSAVKAGYVLVGHVVSSWAHQLCS